ncbi:MAG TPA: hypothetical protein VF518_14115, partial [Polyangia bacterium]
GVAFTTPTPKVTWVMRSPGRNPSLGVYGRGGLLGSYTTDREGVVASDLFARFLRGRPHELPELPLAAAAGCWSPR